MFTLSNFVYAIGNLFMTYVIYKFMRVFYEERNFKKNIEITAYFIYFLLLTMINITIRIPIVTAGLNILFFFIITFLYSFNIRKNIITSLLMFLVLASIDALVALIAFITNLSDLSILKAYNYDSIISIVVVRITCFIFVLLFANFKNLKKNITTEKLFWLKLGLVPFGTIVILIAIFIGEIQSSTMMIVIIVCIIIMNISIFYLYDSLINLLEQKMLNRVMQEQNKYYENQLELMKKSLNMTKTFQHDLKNKLVPIYNIAQEENNLQLIEEIETISDFCKIENEYAKSGNTTIDSVINFKLQRAVSENIKVFCNILIPENFKMSDIDLANILGNIVDNAIEGVLGIAEDRWIKIDIKYTKGRLIFQISNSFNGIVVKKGEKIITKKKDKNNHGIGLESIKRTLKKYNGCINIDYSEKNFNTKVFIYI